MDYQQAEQDLMLGILEALPCPTALLNRGGQTVYVNSRFCPVDMGGVDFSALPEVKTALDGIGQSAFRTELRTEDGNAPGLMEAYPVRVEEALVGALVMFRPDPVKEEFTADALPTVSAAMTAVWDRLQRLSMLNTPVLLLGEGGVGKGDFARALHRLSHKQNAPFVTVTRRDTPQRLLEAAAEAADGTLFCEQIDTWDKPLVREAANLYISRHMVLELEVKPLNARLMASAAPELAEKVKRGEFPDDLYSRMNIMPVFIPPLRDRPEDIPPAAQRFALAHAAGLEKDIQGFSDEAREVLSHQDWPENLNGLRAAVAEAVDACPGGIIQVSALGGLFRADAPGGSLRKIKTAYERDHIRALLNAYGHTVDGKRKAAAEMGISLSTLYRILGSRNL
ncbi:MAG: sigma 54-interacting transcriptional regulator [Oscillospiraceae bacterium]|nr:sigma 54-interacting transcriptional regulator [Oscillospiraceae bacterium]